MEGHRGCRRVVISPYSEWRVLTKPLWVGWESRPFSNPPIVTDSDAESARHCRSGVAQPWLGFFLARGRSTRWQANPEAWRAGWQVHARGESPVASGVILAAAPHGRRAARGCRARRRRRGGLARARALRRAQRQRYDRRPRTPRGIPLCRTAVAALAACAAARGHLRLGELRQLRGGAARAAAPVRRGAREHRRQPEVPPAPARRPRSARRGVARRALR